MKMKLLCLFIPMLINLGITKAQNIEVSPFIAGTNYWVASDYLNGLMAVNGAIDTANFQMIRIGGFGANGYSDEQFLKYIDQIRAVGAEPIVQVSAKKSIPEVKSMITKINITAGRNVKYWAIGNEPDHKHGGSLSEEAVSNYTKEIATALKEVDKTIKTIGFDFAYYKDSSWTKLLGGSCDLTGKDANGNFYLDIISWHKYDISSVADIQSKVNDMLPRLINVNKTRPENPIRWMMGEINMHYDNKKVTYSDGYVWSFWAGQLFTGIWKIGIENNCFSFCEWSIAEGGSNRSGGDLGLFDGEYKGRSIYYHSMMFNQNLKKYYALSTDNQDSVETISMKDNSGIAVMVTNSNKDKTFDYSLRLDNTIGKMANLQIKIDAGIAKEISGKIPAFATQMLVFDNKGVFKKLYTYTSLDADTKRGPTITYPQ